MSQQDIALEYARQVNKNVTKNDLKELSGGYSSVAYKINSKTPFVLMVQRDGAVQQSNYGHAFAILSLLKNHNYPYSPKPLWLDADKKAIAISYFNGTPSDKFDFQSYKIDPKNLAINIIDAALKVSDISLNEYENFMSSIGQLPLPIRELSDDVEDYYWKWLKIVKKSCPDKYIVNWLDRTISEVVKYVEGIYQTKNVFLRHGDISNPNILINEQGKFMLIDWDSSRYTTTGIEFMVAFITSLVDFIAPFKNEIIKHVAIHLHIPEKVFSDRVHEARRYNDAAGINWAAMMMAKVNSGEIKGDIEYFKKIALNRIKIYEKEFNN